MWVSERGPELADLPRGGRVVPYYDDDEYELDTNIRSWPQEPECHRCGANKAQWPDGRCCNWLGHYRGRHRKTAAA